jgi:hypothetical protein
MDETKRWADQVEEEEKEACVFGPNCKKQSNPIHTRKFSHLMRVCRYGNSCNKKMDPSHLREFTHIKQAPCKNGDACPKKRNPKHLGKYTHPDSSKSDKKDKKTRTLACRSGLECDLLDDKEHCEMFNHFELKKSENPPKSNQYSDMSLTALVVEIDILNEKKGSLVEQIDLLTNTLADIKKSLAKAEEAKAAQIAIVISMA